MEGTASSSAAPAQLTDLIGTVQLGSHDQASLLRNQLAPVLQHALNNSDEVTLVVLALLIDNDSALGQKPRGIVADALGEAAAAKVDTFHASIRQLPSGMRLPLLDRAMPALLRLPDKAGEQILHLAHALIACDGPMTLAEFFLFTVLERRLGADAQQRVPVKYHLLQDLRGDAALVLSLIASVRLPQAPERAFAAATVPGIGVSARSDVIAHDAVSAALHRLNQLAPPAKSAFLRNCAAVAFVDQSTTWEAASCLRTICTAIDSPLPPQLAANDGMASTSAS